MMRSTIAPSEPTPVLFAKGAFEAHFALRIYLANSSIWYLSGVTPYGWRLSRCMIRHTIADEVRPKIVS